MPVYTLGFPGGRMMGGVVGNIKNNPAITVNAMSISSFRRDEGNRLARVQLNGSTIEGKQRRTTRRWQGPTGRRHRFQASRRIGRLRGPAQRDLAIP